MSLLLSKIDELTRGDHYYLTEDDDCRYIREYAARGGYKAGPTNQLISNLKKSPSKRYSREWEYKLEAIGIAAQEFCNCTDHNWLKATTLIPIPPSRMKGDPEYDERMYMILRQINRRLGNNLDIRELILQRENRQAFHEQTGRRPRPQEVAANYYIDEELMLPTPQAIGLFDDMLTTGSHFKGAQMILEEAFPGVPIRGIFLARRVPHTDEDLFASF